VTGTGERDLQELAAAYALGALDAAETRAFEAFLAANPAAAREVADYREVSALLALGTADAGSGTPSQAVRDRVLARARAMKQVGLPSRRPWMLWGALAASLIAAAGLALNQRALRRELTARDSAIAMLTETLAAREERLRQREATLNSLLEPAVTLTNLVSTGAPEPGMQFFWNRKTNRATVHASNLTPAAANRVFQLWFIPKGGKPIPSVTFNSETSGHALVEQITVPADQELTAAAITDEPEGGSAQPTTPVLMVGAFAPGKS
jgi:anti-sigma-K factor RskA